MARSFIVTADGGSRGNPGPAAYGAVVFEGDKVLTEVSGKISQDLKRHTKLIPMPLLKFDLIQSWSLSR